MKKRDSALMFFSMHTLDWSREGDPWIKFGHVHTICWAPLEASWCPSSANDTLNAPEEHVGMGCRAETSSHNHFNLVKYVAMNTVSWTRLWMVFPNWNICGPFTCENTHLRSVQISKARCSRWHFWISQFDHVVTVDPLLRVQFEKNFLDWKRCN